MLSVITLILIFTRSFGFFTTLYAGALVILFLTEIRQNAGLCTTAFKTLKSAVQRFILFYVDFRHLFPSLQIHQNVIKGPIFWLNNDGIIAASTWFVNNHFAGLRIKFTIFPFTTIVFTISMPSRYFLIFSSAQAAAIIAASSASTETEI